MKLKRKIPLLKVVVEPGANYNQLTKIPIIQEVVNGEVLIAVREAVKKKRKKIVLFEVADSGYYIELEKENFKKSLQSAMDYFVEKEDYDKCIECRDLINNLD